VYGPIELKYEVFLVIQMNSASGSIPQTIIFEDSANGKLGSLTIDSYKRYKPTKKDPIM
jgi:hypothetical protein